MSDTRLRELGRAADAGDQVAEQQLQGELRRAGRLEEALRRAYFAGDDEAGERWTRERARLGLSVRQTGRTTRMVRRAIGAMREGWAVVIYVPTYSVLQHVDGLFRAWVAENRGEVRIIGRWHVVIDGERLRGINLRSNDDVFYDNSWDETFPVPGKISESPRFAAACRETLNNGFEIFEWDERIGPNDLPDDAFIGPDPMYDPRRVSFQVRRVELSVGRLSCPCGQSERIILAAGRPPRPLYCRRCGRRSSPNDRSP